MDRAALDARAAERLIGFPAFLRASREAVLGSTDFRSLTEREHLLDIEALMRRLARRLRQLRLRRQAPAQAGRRLDLRSTIRRSAASGGTPLDLAWQDRRRGPTRPASRRCCPICWRPASAAGWAGGRRRCSIAAGCR